MLSPPHHRPIHKPIIIHRHPGTSPMIWCASIICSIVAIAVFVGGIVLFVGYLVIRPKVPQISVASAQLGNIYFDEASLLTVQLAITLKLENDNMKAHATFYATNYSLSFHGSDISYLGAGTYDLPKNSSREFHYFVESVTIPLEPDDAELVSFSLKEKVIKFQLKGNTKTRWRVWLLGSFKFWLHLKCELQLPTDRSTISPRCISTYT